MNSKGAKTFIHEDFLLYSDTAKFLYHDHAAKMPVVDYHNHLSVKDIAEDKVFQNITKIWLSGDHYKWRAMRANGIEEFYITGNGSDGEKFNKWADTVPYTLRNPLYHWTHMELKNYFGINELLHPSSAKSIYSETSEKLNTPSYSVKNLLGKMNVEILCTTDDPADDLNYHNILNHNFKVRVLPTFRADQAIAIEDHEKFNTYADLIAEVCNIEISNFEDYITALQKRHDYFGEHGCKISDHGLETIYTEDYQLQDIQKIFVKARKRNALTSEEVLKFKSAMLYHLAVMDAEKGWVQQFHLGVLRNNNSRLKKSLGGDAGTDSMGDSEIAKPLSKFLDRLNMENKLAKTILYNINPQQNETFATMVGNFQDSSVAGKMQYGAAWWFLDQKDGIEKQINTLSNMGLLSRFIGMLTDSRSFLSFSRHEYFRRILCNMIGSDVEKGEIPNDKNMLVKMVEDISYNNAKSYFNF